jgi:hypothetical protein
VTETSGSFGSCNRQFVFIRKFIHAENGNDILQVLVFLEDLLRLPATW